jgi:CDP-L-myo-inositol myo-inositolphosphotransferase
MNSYTADKYGGIMRKLLGDKQPPFRIGRDIRLFIIFIGALFNYSLACLLLLAVIMNLETIRRIFLVYKYRDAGI